MDIVLRPYQTEAVDSIRALFGAGCRKVLLYGMTGFGKTEVFAWIVHAMIEKGKKCFIVTRGRDLVYNAHARLIERGLNPGIIMAGNDLACDRLVYVISIDTFLRRPCTKELRPDLIVIDEAHFAGAQSFISLSTRYPEAYFLGVTASPWPEKSIKHIAEHWVAPVTYDQLVGQGYLVPPKTYAPLEVDLAGVKVNRGDYVESSLYGAMDKRHIYGNILSNYVNVTAKAKALCFCVNIAHSKNMADIFNANGIRARHLDAGSSDDSRKEAIDLLKRGELDVITNCNILSTGIDLPCLSGVISARPTKSRILWVQQAGRGSRPFDGKSFFYLMDHANNTREHGFIEEFHPPLLDGRPKGLRKGIAPVKTCPSCFMVLPAQVICCPCGHEFVIERETAVKPEARIVELKRETLEHPLYKEAASIVRECYTRGYKRGSIFMRLKAKHGEWAAKKFSSRVFVESIVAQIEHDRARQGLEKLRGFGDDKPRTDDKVWTEGIERYLGDRGTFRRSSLYRDQDG